MNNIHINDLTIQNLHINVNSTDDIKNILHELMQKIDNIQIDDDTDDEFEMDLDNSQYEDLDNKVLLDAIKKIKECPAPLFEESLDDYFKRNNINNTNFPLPKKEY